MVDAVISYVVSKLGDFLIEQAVFLRGVKGQVKWLQRELRLLRSYLKDAEQKQGSDESIRIWLSEIQEIVFDIEDTIDDFILKVNEEPIDSSTRGRMRSYVKNSFCCIYENANLYDIGNDIEALKERVLEISRQRKTYGINIIASTQKSGTSDGGGQRTTTPYGDEELDVVGFEDDFEFLQKKLFDGIQSRSVVSILGMGGLGKTTLARKLYNNNKIKFTRHAWICVSQEWTPENLLQKLIKSFVELTNEEREKVDKMELSELERYLYNLLEESPYLVVIDDVWHQEAWESIRKACPDNKNGSRMIITTRKKDVAALKDHATHVHKLGFLQFEESWSLFCKKAFPSENGECPKYLETLGKEMTKKCGGLPLAIVVLGGLLSRKEYREWEAVKDHIWREVKEDSFNDISPLLDLSYNDLPSDLKPCFLYLSIFSEDALINVQKLMKLWIAEKFIPVDEEGRTLEEVSERYFKELLGRNLVQTVKRNWRMTSSCQVHDLLRDLVLKKARETNFLRVYNHTGSSSYLSTTSCRRFAVDVGFSGEQLRDNLHKKVRTLCLLNYKSNDNWWNENNVSIVGSFRLLRVLKLESVDLSGGKKSRFFKAVGEMIHLRYLGLKNSDVDELPNSLENLKALQTLILKQRSNCISLPKGICKLKELRHLTGYIYTKDLSNLAGLSSLQTLKVFVLWKEENVIHDINFFTTLSNLRKLRMDFSFDKSICISIKPLYKCKELIELKMLRLERELPKGIHNCLTKLKYLLLQFNILVEDPIPNLEMLPNLLILDLSYSSNETISLTLTFTAIGFPQLEFLKLQSNSETKLHVKLHVDERAMPRLRFLCMENLEFKKTILPERFRSLPGEEAMNWKFKNIDFFM